MTTKIKLLIVIVFLSGINWDLRAQDIELTKAQMYEDFDSLVSIIEYNNPHLGIYKKAMDFDVIENIKQQRPKIEDIKDIAGYFILTLQCFNLIPEIHAKTLVLGEKAIKEYADSALSNPVVIRSGDLQHTIDIYNSIVKKGAKYDELLNLIYLPVKYINGNYYFTRPLQIINQKDTMICNTGDIITRINEIPIGKFVSENHRKYFDKLRWDTYNHCFYTDHFLWVTNFPQGSFPFANITIKKSDEKQEVVSLNTNTRFWIYQDEVLLEEKTKFKPYDQKPVIWCKDSLLYVKIPSMNRGDLNIYETEIPRICKNQKISNVILDVRRNGGGSDHVWGKVLNLLTDQPLYRHQILGVNTPLICEQQIVGNRDSIPPLYDKLLNKKYTIIDNNSWAVSAPDTNSIFCKGKIYVLHDEKSYSAANTLVTFALDCDKVVAVGNPIGYLSGYGVDPFVFQLPISKLLFMMHSVIQIPQKASSVESYLWNETEIRVIPTIRYENLLAEYGQDDILYQYNFLKEYDPYFQAVINDIKTKQ